MAYQGVNQPKPLGSPIDLYREHVSIGATAIYNGGAGGLTSASQAAATDTDDFRMNSTISIQPNDLGTLYTTTSAGVQSSQAITLHLRDLTNYPEGNVRTDSWIEHLRGKSGAKNDANSNV